MPFAGALLQAQPYTFEIQSAGPSALKGAVTVFTIRKDRVSEVETLSATGGATQRTINTGVARLVFMVTPVAGGTVLFKVSQGGLLVEETVSTDQQFVFDIA